MNKIDLKKRKTIKTVAKAAYTAPLTMTLLTSKRALAQSPPCDPFERTELCLITAATGGYSVGELAPTRQNDNATIDINFGHTWDTRRIPIAQIDLSFPEQGFIDTGTTEVSCDGEFSHQYTHNNFTYILNGVVRNS